MLTPEEWSEARSRLLTTGTEVHGLFSIGRKVGVNMGKGVEDYVTLDFVRTTTDQRLLGYPSFLAEGSQPMQSSDMPFPLLVDGALTKEGVDIRIVPRGTQPLLRLAQSYDTPNSGAPQRPDIFRRAGNYIGTLWKNSRLHLPQDLSLDMLAYISKGEGVIAIVPPNQYVYTPNPNEVLEVVANQLIEGAFAPDQSHLAQELEAGVREVIYSEA